MGGKYNLDEVGQTVICIPYSGSDEENDEDHLLLLPESPTERDLPNGNDLRLKAYRDVWTKCLNRVQSIVRDLLTPVANSVVEEIHNSYSMVLPGLLFPEIPVVCVTNVTPGSAFTDQVTRLLDQSMDCSNPSSFAIHLYPTDATNIIAAMKSIVTGFTEQDVLEQVKRKTSTSLLNYDINMLVAWYEAVNARYKFTKGSGAKLIVMLHDFEQYEASILQDVFDICSLHVPKLPLVFVLWLSSPPSPSFIHLTYPRSTLSLLRIRTLVVPSGTSVLEEILLKTFFDPTFEPDVVVGPATLAYLQDYFARYNTSTDVILTIFQLTYMKHFNSDPFSLLVSETPPLKTLQKPTSYPFVQSLVSRIHISSKEWKKQTIPSLLTLIDDARLIFYSRARRMRVGFNVFRFTQSFMVKQGYKGLKWNEDTENRPLCILMLTALRGTLGRSVRDLAIMIRKLRPDQLSALLGELYAYIQALPTRVRAEEHEARAEIATFRTILSNEDIGSQVGNWFTRYLNDVMSPLENCQLWDVWYTGLSPFPADLLNPSVRASIISGLLRPYDFTEHSGEDVSRSLSQMPDISILFNRYLDSGKKINVYDWFESFQSVLETQRDEVKSSATKMSPKKRGKQKKEVMDEDKEEKWKIEVQARFMRSLQELDHLGFLKHVGKKGDIVQRTVFEISD